MPTGKLKRMECFFGWLFKYVRVHSRFFSVGRSAKAENWEAVYKVLEKWNSTKLQLKLEECRFSEKYLNGRGINPQKTVRNWKILNFMVFWITSNNLLHSYAFLLQRWTKWLDLGTFLRKFASRSGHWQKLRRLVIEKRHAMKGSHKLLKASTN